MMRFFQLVKCRINMLGAIFLVAVAGTAFADPNAIFPEDAPTFPGSRIVSGWEAEDGQFPHQLSLRLVSPAGSVTSCGGSIIKEDWGLTAAHCTVGRVTLVIRAGTVNLTRPAVIFETQKYFLHPAFSQLTPGVVQPNDIALIDFDRKLTFSELIQPIRLQRSSAKDQNYEGLQATASGWGRTWTNGASPENLNWVYLKLVSNEECLEAYGGSAIIAPSTICTVGYSDPTQSTCQGDSGGPLTAIDDDGVLSQVGVTSFVSRFGCHVGIPSGFVRPGYYHDWFVRVTGEDFDWSYDAPEDESTDSPESEGTTEDPPSEEDPDSPPSEEDPDSPPSEEEPDSPPSEEDPDSPPSEEDPDSPPSEEKPDSPESEEKPDSPESEEEPDFPEPEPDSESV